MVPTQLYGYHELGHVINNMEIVCCIFEVMLNTQVTFMRKSHTLMQKKNDKADVNYNILG